MKSTRSKLLWLASIIALALPLTAAGMLLALRPGLKGRLLRRLTVKSSAEQTPASTGKRVVHWDVMCDATTKPINPMIYGIGVGHDRTGEDEWWLNAAARRWGGNPSTRYNWQLGAAWNTGSDWFFENLDYMGESGYSYREFLRRNREHDMQSALTVPIMGWVAKDTHSVGFPRAQWPEQDYFDYQRPEAGNGVLAGVSLPAGSPSQTSVAAPPSFVRAWVDTIVREDHTAGLRSVHQYILDNEPNLWHTTHRDVRGAALGYDELLERTIAYGSQVRAADPEAVIAGPAEWGWLNYMQSAKDGESRFFPRDRIDHGMVPLIVYYLRELRAHEQRSGVRILDVLDLHYYPQASQVYSAATDPITSALRIRSTRALWDPTYVDETWIAEPIMLLPRMRAWVADNYPGRGISIGEWSFGAEAHMSGALATAEALGRFGTEGATSAFYWSFPAARSPTAWAFRAYRNFDAHGGHFQSESVPMRSEATDGTSAFASRDKAAKQWVLVLLNFDPARAADMQVRAGVCWAHTRARGFVYAGEDTGFAAATVTSGADGWSLQLPPYAIGVLQLDAE